jgi:hypothetical protein
MLSSFSHFFKNLEQKGHKVKNLGSFSKAPGGFLFWTFINVQNGKPKVEYGFYLLLKKRR